MNSKGVTAMTATGYFGVPGSSRGRFTIHIVDHDRHPLCGWSPRKEMEFQWCGAGAVPDLAECVTCRRLGYALLEREAAAARARARPFGPMRERRIVRTSSIPVVLAHLRALDDASVGVGSTQERALDDAVVHNDKSRSRLRRMMADGSATVTYEKRTML